MTGDSRTAPGRPANERWDGGVVNGGWKPRPGAWSIGELQWIARMSDKARANAQGTSDGYIYPCPVDRRCLGALELDAKTFQTLAVGSHDDDDLVRAVTNASPALREGRYTFEPSIFRALATWLRSLWTPRRSA